MTVERVGQQPVVVRNQGNSCGAKGHSQVTYVYLLTEKDVSFNFFFNLTSSLNGVKR